MRIEKINDNQICCIISSDDLIKNSIKLSELAFGSDKAKKFFQDLMLQAKKQYGFDAMNTPLMIEAIPQLPDCLKLIITKVNDKGAPIEESDAEMSSPFNPDEALTNLFQKVRKLKEGAFTGNKDSAKPAGNGTDIRSLEFDAVLDALAGDSENLDGNSYFEAFRFSTLDNVILAAKAVKGTFDCENSLFKEVDQHSYLLTIHCTDETPEEFNKLCNILTEYGAPIHCSASGESYLREHGCEMITNNALQVLETFN